jgi:uncharacterized membrane protein YkvA (DUF1232 family)
MSTAAWIGVVALAAYVASVAALAVAGRREDARAVAGFVPDCAVLVRRLLADPGVPRRHKLLLGALAAYLALPVDLVPDFIPVAGQLDDAVVLALVLRVVLRGAGAERLAGHWPGPEASLGVVRRLAGDPQSSSAASARTRSAMSSRVARTSSSGRPAGSARSQSR